MEKYILELCNGTQIEIEGYDKQGHVHFPKFPYEHKCYEAVMTEYKPNENPDDVEFPELFLIVGKDDEHTHYSAGLGYLYRVDCVYSSEWL